MLEKKSHEMQIFNMVLVQVHHTKVVSVPLVATLCAM
jgi:hypothetical protein